MYKPFLVVFLALLSACRGYLTLTTIDNGDILSIGTPYEVKWTDDSARVGDERLLVLVRCATSWLATEFCSEAARFDVSLTAAAGAPNGTHLFNATMDQNDELFYRFQMLNKRTMELATSGTFTFAPRPVAVDTR